LRNAKLGIHCVAFAMTLLALVVEAQQPKVAAPAPIPEQILSAKKVFVSNAGEVRNPSGDLTFSGGPDRAYNQFYGSMKTWGKYELVPNPTDADLIFEIGLVGVRDNPFYDQLRLVILDPKTHTILWTFVEHASAGGKQKSRDAAFDRAMGILVDDVKTLSTQTAADVGKN